MKYLVLLLILAFSSSLIAEDKIDQLIKDLGANDPNVRQSADYRLQKIGFPARPLLTEALKNKDPEIQLRASRLLDQLTLEENWLPRRVTLKEKGHSSDILMKLAEQAGNRLYIGNPYGLIKDAEIDVDYSDVPYWEAIDDICRKTKNKMRPHYDNHLPGMVISEGDPGNFSKAYGGPVRGMVTNARRVFTEDLNYEQGNSELVNKFTIGFQFNWEDRFRLVAHSKHPKLIEGLTDNQSPVTAANFTNTEQIVVEGIRQISTSLDLNPIPLSAKSIKTLTIGWDIVGVSAPGVLEMPMEIERIFSRDDLIAQIKSLDFEVNKYSMTILIRRDLANPEPHDMQFHEYEVEVLDHRGNSLNVYNKSFALVEQGIQMKMNFQAEAEDSKPKLVKLRYYRQRARREVRLTFKDIPLPAARPE